MTDEQVYQGFTRFTEDDIETFTPFVSPKAVSYHPLWTAAQVYNAWVILHSAENMRHCMTGAPRRAIYRVWEKP